jgi:type VI protein secretion system component VasA
VTGLDGTALSAYGQVRVTVGLGGVLRGLDIRDEALAQGGRRLAATVLELARLASVQAAQRARHHFRDELAGLPQDALAALGFTDDSELVESAESTTPVTWRDF